MTSAFIGRESELRQLQRRLEAVTNGQGHVILIQGEAGIGKTSLVERFLNLAARRHPQVLTARGQCSERFGSGEGYLPFVEALGALLEGREEMSVRDRILDVVLETAPSWLEAVPAIGQALRASYETAQAVRSRFGGEPSKLTPPDREHVLREYAGVLTRLSENSPILLFLDDLQWSDAASVDLLAHLSRRIEGHRILILGTYRPSDVAVGQRGQAHPLADAILEMGRYNVCEEIVLDRLGREDCSALIAGEFPDHSFPPSLLNLLFDHSEGNALFITEMLRLLREDALVEKRSGTWRLAQPVEDLPLPRSVESVVVMRIERLEADLRRTLRYGSVEGERFLSTVLAGYDFLTDSAQEIKSSLEAHGITTTSLISDTWTADDLRDNLLTTRHDLNGVSAHFEHWRAWPADVESGELTSDDVIVASNNVSGTLLFSVGCHAGLNVPDSWDDDESALDFSQAFAGSGATWVANTGYGYGMDDAAALSERLMGNFVKELGRGSKVPIGRALIRAKQRYVNSASAASLGLYDEKILVETTLYGLPMARVTMPITTETTSPIQGGRVRTSSGPTAGPLSSQTVTVTTLFTEVTTSDGLFYTTTDNEVQASAGRPIQPRVSLDIARTGETARGALFLGGEHHDIEPFNPVIARPVTDTAMTEPLYTLSGWHPTEMAVINRVETAFETLERLVLVPGQFKNPGVERLWDRLTYEVYYSTNGEEDTVDPAIWRAEAAQLPDRVLFNVEVTDDSGIERVVVPYSLGGGTWSHLDLTYDPDEELWTGEFPMNEDDSVSYFVQAVDAAGNVAASDNKGFLFEPVTNNVYVPLILRGG